MNKFIFTLVALFFYLGFSPASYAQIGDGCIIHSDSKKRLNCYDEYYTVYEAGIRRGIMWRTASFDTNGEITNVITLKNSIDLHTIFSGAHYSLDIFCILKEITIMVSAPEQHFFGSTYHKIGVKVDGQKEIQVSVQADYEENVLRFIHADEANAFRKSLVGKSYLTLSFDTVDNKKKEVRFRIDGFKEKSKALAKSCNWSP